MGNLLQDIRYAIRLLTKNPGFTIIAVLTLALGIGANTAIFSVVNGVLLRPLPYPQPDQLISLSEKTANFESSSISYPNFLDWQRRNTSFSATAAYRQEDDSLTGNGETERVRVGMISHGFFKILGIQPVAGRLFTAEEDRLGTGKVALIGGGLWQRRFGSSPDVLGKTLTVNGDGYTVVGIIPRDFRLDGINFDEIKDVYIPIGQNTDLLFQRRDVHAGTRAIARLKPGVTLAAARGEMDQIANDLAAAYPDSNKGAGIRVLLLRDSIVRDVRAFLLILLGAVGFVLLIACVNVANLQLSRATARAREFAIRASLGATQARVMRQLLTESILLALAGGALGLCLAAWGTQAAIRLIPETLPRSQDIGLDWRVLIFTLVASVAAGILFGLAPALKTSQPNLQGTLRESGRGGSGVRSRAQGVFVAVEMAMALVLLVGAGLMIRSLVDLWNVKPGFNAQGVLTFGVTMSPSLGATPGSSRAAIRSLEEQLKSVPGIEAVAPTAGALPMYGDNELPFWPEDKPRPANETEMYQSLFYITQPGYLNVMGISLLRGRFFTADDNENSPGVVVIDEDFARQYFPDQDPVGKRIHVGIFGMDPQIVGIVGHVKHWGLGVDGDAQHPIRAQAYLPLMQLPDRLWSGAPGAEVVARTKGSPAALVPAIRDAVRKVNAENVVYDPEPMEQIVGESLAGQRFSMILLSVFAVIALLLSSIGIYGVLSYVVAQRTREIGIRIALGAQRSAVLRLMLSEGMRMALVGVAIGVALALGLTRLMASQLYGVSASDPLTFAGVALLLVGVALFACYIPARRAMRVDPIVALRYE
jgi:predicted permease